MFNDPLLLPLTLKRCKGPLCKTFEFLLADVQMLDYMSEQVRL